jgi:hypothetical protein
MDYLSLKVEKCLNNMTLSEDVIIEDSDYMT